MMTSKNLGRSIVAHNSSGQICTKKFEKDRTLSSQTEKELLA